MYKDTLLILLKKHHLFGGDGLLIRIKNDNIISYTLHSDDYKHYSLDSIKWSWDIDVPVEKLDLKKEFYKDSIRGNVIAVSKKYLEGIGIYAIDKFEGKFICKIKNNKH